MTYIVIGEETYPVDTQAEIDAAKAALREAGEAEAPVWTGDPEGTDSYKNGQILFA